MKYIKKFETKNKKLINKYIVFEYEMSNNFGKITDIDDDYITIDSYWEDDIIDCYVVDTIAASKDDINIVEFFDNFKDAKKFYITIESSKKYNL